MDRRSFLKTGVGTFAALGLSRGGWTAPLVFNPSPAAGWRVFEIVTRIEPPATAGITRVWLPLPAVEEAAWQKPLGNLWLGDADAVAIIQEPVYKTAMLLAQWSETRPGSYLELTSRAATRDRASDWTKAEKVLPLDPAQHALYTSATDLLPTDGIVRETAMRITQGARTDVDKARAIYEWIVENTQRNPQTRGCGLGDIRFMLESGDLSGKCADLNALFVGLARAAGLPARDVYGIRVADSRFGYKSLGKSGDVSKAQHCRAEVWLDAFGWVPVDPADVRKVVLEEKTGLRLEDDLVNAVRRKLFGAWEMNWVAYSFAHDLTLPDSKGAKIPFFMYPQGENAKGRFDSLDPASFAYRITAREVASA